MSIEEEEVEVNIVVMGRSRAEGAADHHGVRVPVGFVRRLSAAEFIFRFAAEPSCNRALQQQGWAPAYLDGHADGPPSSAG